MNKEQLTLIEQEFSQIKSVYFNAAYLGPSPARCRAGVEESLNKELERIFLEKKREQKKEKKEREKLLSILIAFKLVTTNIPVT